MISIYSKVFLISSTVLIGGCNLEDAITESLDKSVKDVSSDLIQQVSDVINDTASSVDDNTTSSVDDNTTSSVDDNTASSVDDNTVSSVDDNIIIIGSSSRYLYLKDGKIKSNAYSFDNTVKQQVMNGIKNVVTDGSIYYALKDDGTVVTWGTAYSYSPPSSDELTNISEIVMSGGAFAALKNDGTVITWGDSYYGSYSEPVQKLLTDIVLIKAATYAFAALKDDGTVITWGNSSYGGSDYEQLHGIEIKHIEPIDYGFIFIDKKDEILYQSYFGSMYINYL